MLRIRCIALCIQHVRGKVETAEGVDVDLQRWVREAGAHPWTQRSKLGRCADPMLGNIGGVAEEMENFSWTRVEKGWRELQCSVCYFVKFAWTGINPGFLLGG